MIVKFTNVMLIKDEKDINNVLVIYFLEHGACWPGGSASPSDGCLHRLSTTKPVTESAGMGVG